MLTRLRAYFFFLWAFCHRRWGRVRVVQTLFYKVFPFMDRTELKPLPDSYHHFFEMNLARDIYKEKFGRLRRDWIAGQRSVRIMPLSLRERWPYLRGMFVSFDDMMREILDASLIEQRMQHIEMTARPSEEMVFGIVYGDDLYVWEWIDWVLSLILTTSHQRFYLTWGINLHHLWVSFQGLHMTDNILSVLTSVPQKSMTLIKNEEGFQLRIDVEAHDDVPQESAEIINFVRFKRGDGLHTTR